jgi:NADH:ubiquinone oxidoreductase subunit 6 (subunit J)
VVVSSRNPVVSAIWLVVCFIAVAGIYALLKAPFLAMVQILVYAGAIMVLFVMIIMFLDLGKIETSLKGTEADALIRRAGRRGADDVLYDSNDYGKQYSMGRFG